MLDIVEVYIESFRGRNFDVYLFGEFVEELVDYLIICFFINVMVVIFGLVEIEEDVVIVFLFLFGVCINCFLYIMNSQDDLVKKV